MRVVIILPTYNEKGNIERLISILQNEIFPKIKKHDMSILVVDDNSPDGTGDEVKKLMKKWSNIRLNTGDKKGLGAALIRGMSYAVGDLKADVLFGMDADLFHDPKKIPEFLSKIEKGYDMVIGTRYSNGGSIPPNWGLHRKIFSIFGNLIVRTILMRFRVHDWTGGFRAIKREVFLREKNELTSFKGYTFQVAFLHKAVRDGYKIAEVPFLATDRTLGRSKIAPLEYITNLLKYVVNARFTEVLHSSFLKYAITGLVGYGINAITLEVLFRNGLHPGIAGAIGGELAIIWNFSMNNFWSFSKYRITKPIKLLLKFPQFNFVALGSLIIISTVLTVGTHFYGSSSRQVLLIIAIFFLVIPYSYTMYNIFIWKRWRISFLAKLQKAVG
jgi:dolichol-phosphate mannosyltransferase